MWFDTNVTSVEVASNNVELDSSQVKETSEFWKIMKVFRLIVAHLGNHIISTKCTEAIKIKLK